MELLELQRIRRIRVRWIVLAPRFEQVTGAENPKAPTARKAAEGERQGRRELQRRELQVHRAGPLGGSPDNPESPGMPDNPDTPANQAIGYALGPHRVRVRAERMRP